MSGKSLPLPAIPLQVRRQEYNGEKGEPSASQTPRNLQISCSPFKLPDDWIVKERPRSSCTGSRQIDRYYYEPGTGKKFRSLISVQRHLMEESREAKSVKPGNEDTTYIEPKTGQQFHSLIAIQRYLCENNGFTAAAKPLLNHGREKQRAPGEKCCTKDISKRSIVAEEDEIYLKSLKLTAECKNSKKSCSPMKTNLEKDSNASMVNLSNPPAKVKWVLSVTGGFWTPFLDGSKVPESVKQKWSNAFISCIQDGIIMN